MMRQLISASLHQRVLVVFAAAVLVAIGIRRSREIPVDVFPEFAPPIVEVQTEAPGLSTEEVDELVTVPLEGALIGAPGVHTVRSKSVLRLSSIVLVLEDDANPLAVRQSVQERLGAGARLLPTNVKAPVMLPALSALSRVMKIGVTSTTLPMLELSELVRWTVRPRLMGIPGVRNFGAHIGRAEVADEVVGPDFTELWISLDPAVDRDATVTRITEVIDGYPGLYRDLLTYLKERIKEVLTGASASIVTRIYGPDLGVLRSEAEAVAAAMGSVEGLVDLHPESQVLVPRLQVTLDTRAVERYGLTPRAVRDTLATLVFPPGYHPEFLGEFQAQREARNKLMVLALLSVLAMLAFLHAGFRSVRPTLLILFGLPFAIAGGVLAVRMTGGVLSLGSFIGFITVLGVGARNSILLLDHYRHLELEEGMIFGRELVLRGALERLAPILMTALTTALALLPIVMRPGQPGTEIEQPMAVVILAGLVSTTLLSLVVLPPLYLLVGRGAACPREAEA